MFKTLCENHKFLVLKVLEKLSAEDLKILGPGWGPGGPGCLDKKMFPKMMEYHPTHHLSTIWQQYHC